MKKSDSEEMADIIYEKIKLFMQMKCGFKIEVLPDIKVYSCGVLGEIVIKHRKYVLDFYNKEELIDVLEKDLVRAKYWEDY